MTTFYHCLICRKIAPLADGAEAKCPICGGTNGEELTAQRVERGMKSGAYFDIDPKTGGRAKKKRRQR